MGDTAVARIRDELPYRISAIEKECCYLTGFMAGCATPDNHPLAQTLTVMKALQHDLERWRSFLT